MDSTGYNTLNHPQYSRPEKVILLKMIPVSADNTTTVTSFQIDEYEYVTVGAPQNIRRQVFSQ